MNPIKVGVLAAVANLALVGAAAAQVASIPAPKLGGYLQAREIAQEEVGLTAVVNRARFSVDGSLPSRFGYRLLVECEASAGARVPAIVSLREAIARWAPSALAVTAGQFKTPFSREYLIPVPLVETADLAAVVDSLAPKYDVGVMVEYAVPWVSISAGVFNGEGQNSVANRDSSALPVARAVLRPLAQFAVGASYARDSDDSLRWGVEANLEQRGAVVRAEYITRHRRGRATEEDDSGWYVFVGYRLLRPVQLIGRVEDFRRPAYGPARGVRAVTAGANFEIAPNRVRLLLEGLRRTSGAAHAGTTTAIAQLQVRF